MTSLKLHDLNERDCPAVEQPFVTFVRLIREKIDACGQLEQIANSLPNHVDIDQCAKLFEQLPDLLGLCDDINQRVIFPLLLRHQSHSYFTHSTAERLVDERLMNQVYALEVSELLAQLAKAESIQNVEASGYLLRSFFETVRRSCAFDLEYIIPMTWRYLTAEEITMLASMLKKQRLIIDVSCISTRRSLSRHRLH
jgi:hypothetical protein